MMRLHLLLLATVLTSCRTHGKVLFDGDASKPFKDVWKTNNCKDPHSNIAVDYDGTLGVSVWQFTKGEGDHRCEGHGAKGFQAQDGDDICIGWNLNLDLQPQTLTTNANFQWKAFPGENNANYPVIMKTIDGSLVLEHYDHSKKRTTLWTSGFNNDEWTSVVLRMKISRDAKKGLVQFWFNGKKQTFKNGKTIFQGATLDGDYTDPKWGVYGGDDGSVVNKVGNIKIATTLDEAMPPNN